MSGKVIVFAARIYVLFDKKETNATILFSFCVNLTAEVNGLSNTTQKSSHMFLLIHTISNSIN